MIYTLKIRNALAPGYNLVGISNYGKIVWLKKNEFWESPDGQIVYPVVSENYYKILYSFFYVKTKLPISNIYIEIYDK